MVLTALAGKTNVSSLTFADIREVFGDGSVLARHNQHLKSYTMVFGTNGPLTQPAYKKVKKNESLYVGTLAGLLSYAETEGNAGQPCDLTGMITDLDFHAVVSAALAASDLPVPQQKWIGRDWVPLGGSLGNDAQALPGASRPLHVSALALFALQYLPLGVFLHKGKLTCYQSTASGLPQSLVSEIVERNRDPLQVGILGKGTGSRIVLEFLLRHFERLHEHRIDESLPENTELLLWLFSNSGAGADCLQEWVPEIALRFIHDAQLEYSHEIRTLLKGDPKNSHFQLFECVRSGRDYPGLYRNKKWPGTSCEFYAFYQISILGTDPIAIPVASKLASLVMRESTAKERQELAKPEYLRSSVGKNQVRKTIAEHLSLAEYSRLFPSSHHPVRVEQSGWELLRFYLGQDAVTTPQSMEDISMKTTHPKIIQIGDAYFQLRGTKKIKATLDRLAQRKLGVRWLQDVFCLLAADENYKDFNLGTWDEFACDEEGKPIVFELLFQLRLYLANKYRESIAIKPPTQHKETTA